MFYYYISCTKEKNMVLWILVLMAGCGAFLGMMVYVLPKLFLKNRYAINEPYDRGLKKYKLQDSGCAIVYEPSLEVRKYIRQYILTNQYGEKKIKCKIRPNIKFLDYDIVLFNNLNEAFLVLNTKDMIQDSGYTQEVALPKETSYVTILLNQVDGRKFKQYDGVKVSASHMAWYIISCIGFSVAVAFCMKLSLSCLFGGLFRYSFMTGWGSNVTTAVSSVLIGAIGAILSAVILVFKSKKK